MVLGPLVTSHCLRIFFYDFVVFVSLYFCFSLMFNGYIQSHFPEETDEESTSKLSPIGAVMGFLYA